MSEDVCPFPTSLPSTGDFISAFCLALVQALIPEPHRFPVTVAVKKNFIKSFI